MAQWRPRVLAIALLLLGGSLAVVGLALPWWHFGSYYDGPPCPDPANAYTFTPGVGWDPHDVVGHLLLVCPVVAVIAGLVALLPSVRPLGWLKALLILLAVLVMALTALLIYSLCGLGCAGATGLVVLFLSARPLGWLKKALPVLLVVLAAAMGCAGLALAIEGDAPFFLDGPCRIIHDGGPLLSGLGYALIFVGDALVFWILAAARTPSAVRQ